MFSKVYNTVIFASLLLMVVLLISSCTTVKVLDGLCYNDRDGTYLCPKIVEIEEIVITEKVPEIIEELE